MFKIQCNKNEIVLGNTSLPAKAINKSQQDDMISIENSYENRAANSAITCMGKALVKKRFVPAQTYEELKNQIKNTKWLDDDKKDIYSLGGRVDTPEKIKMLSEFWHKLDDLSLSLQKNIDPNRIIMSFENMLIEQNIDLIKNFSIENINKMNPNLRENLGNHFEYNIIGLSTVDMNLVNKFYNTVDDKYKANVFFSAQGLLKSNKEIEKYIVQAQALNNLNNEIAKKFPPNNVVYSALPSEIVNELVVHLNSLSEDEFNKLSSSYLERIFDNNYSFALDNNNNKQICGTDKFSPFTNKKQLKAELATLKTQNGEWMFTNDDINKIINNENDIGELSKILDSILANKIELAPYSLKRILLKEGITLKEIQPGLNLIKHINTNESFAEVRNAFLQNEQLLKIDEKEAKTIKENVYIIDIMKKHTPEDYERDIQFCANNILDVLKSSKIKPEILEEILSQDLFPSKLDVTHLKNLVKDEKINETKEQNVKFLKDLKNTPTTAFLYNDVKDGISNYDIVKILQMELPDKFDINNQSEMLKLIDYIRADKDRRDIIGTFNGIGYVELLTQNGNYEDGKKLIDYIVRSGLIGGNTKQFLIKNTFKENYDLLQKIENIGILNKETDYGGKAINNYNIDYPMDVMNDALELAKYADEKAEFDGAFISLRSNYKNAMERKEYGLEPNNKAEIKENIDKLAEISHLMTPTIWHKIREEALETVLENDSMKKLKYKKENIEYFNKFIADNDKTKIFDIYRINDLLQADLDIDALNANYNDKFEFVKKYGKEIDNRKLITFTGDIKKLEDVYLKLKEDNKTQNVDLAIDESTNEITFTVDNKLCLYDKNLNFLSSATINTKQRKDGETLSVVEYKDYKKNIDNTTTYKKDSVYNEKVPTHVVSRYLDDSKNIQKIRIYDESGLDGTYNIKELYPDGKIKNISNGYSNENGEFIEKNLESLDGTKSRILYKKDAIGNENYQYNIIDKDGNELLNLNRTTEIIDENAKITTVNGRKYKVSYSKDSIKIYDFSNNNECSINLKEFNPDNDSVLQDSLKSLSGDELLNVKEYVKELELINRISSGMDPINKKMYIGPHKFIFEHELGHAKDEFEVTIEELAKLENIDDAKRKITSDPNLQAIFEAEKKLMKEHLPEDLYKEADYFINDTTHYAGKLGGLSEAIAETNAIYSTAKFHPLLMMRTELLQEYFPKTIAYLISNKL